MIHFDIAKQVRGQNGNLSLQLKGELFRREIVLLSGVSGAGKSTLLRMLSGLVSPDTGAIKCHGVVWQDGAKTMVKPADRKIALLHQDFNLFPNMTLLENLNFANSNATVDEKAELLAALELTELQNSKPHKLSGGQQQRAALARTLVQKSSLILLDEPLSAQDEDMKSRIIQLLGGLKQRSKAAWLVVSHQAPLFKGVADEQWKFEKGKITPV